MKTIPAYLAFLGMAWLLADRLDYRVAIAGALMAWLAVALIVFFATRSL